MHTRTRPMQTSIVALALALSCSSAVRAETPIGSEHPKADNVTTVGTMRVERYGSGKPAMILVPGLSCGSWVWDEEIRAFSPAHTLYVVTLGGFDGLPAPAGDPLDAADASLAALIASQKIDRPVIVGHSLGGFLALRFATEHPNLIRGVVSVDGTPVFPAFAAMTPDARKAASDSIVAQLKSASPAEYLAQQQKTVATMVSDPAKAAQVAALIAKSDQTATATYAGALFASDLRPQLSKLTGPALVVAPVPATPMPFEPPQAASQTLDQRAAGYQQFYAALMTGAPNLHVVTVEKSLHFVMVDQPKALDDAISSFLGSLPG